MYITIEKNDFGTGGHVSPTKVNLLFENDGAGQMTEITEHPLVEESSHGITFTDHDNDGDLDALLIRYSWSNDGHNNFFINEGNDNSWILLTCEGTLSNRTSIGTRIIAKATINGQPVMQTREITPMHGHFTYPSLRVHFGLGDAGVIDTLLIRWPSGHVDEYLNIQANQFYRAIEDSGLVIDFKATNYIEYSPAIADKLFLLEDTTITIDLNDHYKFIKGDTVPEIAGDTLNFSFNNENPGVVTTTLNGSILTLEAGNTISESKINIITKAVFTERMDHFTVTRGVYDIDDHSIERDLIIHPNPFTGATFIRYQIKDKRYLISDLYSISGIHIKRLLNEDMMPGTYEMEVDLNSLPAGVYFIRFVAGDQVVTKKLIIK